MDVLNTIVGPQDFPYYATGENWTTVSATSGTVTVSTTQATGENLALVYTTPATDHDYCGVKSTNPIGVWDGRGMGCIGRHTFVSHASNDAAVVFGFSSTATNLSLTTGNVAATGTHALIYKPEDSLFWRVSSCTNSGTQNIDITQQAATDGTYLLEVGVTVFDALNVLVTFAVNGNQCTDSLGRPIQHKCPIASANNMYVISLGQAGSANAQTVYAQKLGHYQRTL